MFWCGLIHITNQFFRYRGRCGLAILHGGKNFLEEFFYPSWRKSYKLDSHFLSDIFESVNRSAWDVDEITRFGEVYFISQKNFQIAAYDVKSFILSAVYMGRRSAALRNESFKLEKNIIGFFAGDQH